ncbi:MAG: U32 family peptidase [Clostridiales bacterium]|nr:U32 family peptidase [Clostridiales bacterium]
MNKKKVELLAPAGDLERLKVAILYGADAVYLGGNAFGLRAKAKNFSIEEMEEGVKFAHSHNAKVYVTCNIFAHNSDINNEKLIKYLKELEKINVDGVIVADPGVFSIVKETVPNMEVHISTQANTTNYQTAKFWKSLGATRVVMAREMSFKEIKALADNVEDIEIEAFVHGAMCMAYSGRCLLSNYFTNRDANRGACAQSCRWKYKIVEETRPGEYYPIEEDERGTYIFNSKDLCMIQYIPELIESGVYSFKIEGRVKTSYYVGSVIKSYREAIDDYLTDPALYESKKEYYLDEVKKSSYRGYTTGFFLGKPDEDAQVYTSNSYVRTYDFIGLVKEYDKETGFAIIEQRNKFVVGEEIEFLTTNGKNFSQKVVEMYDTEGNRLEEAPHPQQIIKLKVDNPVSPFDMMRKESDNPVLPEDI